MTEFKRGDIFIADFGTGIGSEQGGVRPCIVIQNDKGNATSPTIIVFPITSKTKKYCLTHVEIDCLRLPSIILCEQPRTISKDRCSKFVCHIDKDSKIMKQVNDKIKISLQIN